MSAGPLQPLQPASRVHLHTSVRPKRAPTTQRNHANMFMQQDSSETTELLTHTCISSCTHNHTVCTAVPTYQSQLQMQACAPRCVRVVTVFATPMRLVRGPLLTMRNSMQCQTRWLWTDLSRVHPNPHECLAPIRLRQPLAWRHGDWAAAGTPCR